jgi:hypothetical protein
MKSIRTYALSLAGILAGAAVVAQTPTPPAPPAPPTAPALAGWEDYYRQSQSGVSAQRLAQKYIKTEKVEEKQELRKKLTDIVGQQFDTRLQQQQKELNDLEKQIANLRAVMKKRQDNKTAIVERRIDQLIQDADGMGWSNPGHLHGEFFDLHVPAPPVEAPEALRKP